MFAFVILVTHTINDYYNLSLILNDIQIEFKILGFYKSLEFGLKPDNPSESETITRVVKGVTIYPFPHV